MPQRLLLLAGGTSRRLFGSWSEEIRAWRTGLGYRSVRRILFGCVVLLAIGIATVTLDAWSRRNVVEREFDQSMSATAQVATEYVRLVFDAIDLRMREAVRHHADWRAGSDKSADRAHRMLVAAVAETPYLNGIGWFDAEGVLVASSLGVDRPRFSIAKEPQFRNQVERDAGLYISNPQRAFGSGVRIIAVSRRLGAPGEPFSGVANGFTDLRALQAGLESIPRTMPADIHVRLPSGALLLSTSHRGGHMQIVQHRAVIEPSALEVEVGGDLEGALAPWRQHVALTGSFLLLLTLITIGGFRLFVHELEARRVQEERVRRAEASLREAQRIAAIGAWELDHRAGTLIWSEETVQLFGLPDAGRVASFEYFLRHVHADDRDRLLMHWRATLGTRAPFSFECRLGLCDGSERLVHVIAETDYGAGSEPLISVGTIQDVTEQRRIEHELHASELRRIAADTARVEAERANRAKSEFLSRMSHELRTPMNAILGFAQVLEAEPLTPGQSGYTREIRAAGDHLLALIDDLLDLSRVEEGRMELAINPVNLNAVLNQALRLVTPWIEARRITLVNACSEHVLVLADGTRLRQVLVNLLSNAAKYNRMDGRIDIVARISGPTLRLEIADTGRGIPAERVGDLFQPFERIGADKSGVDGTGIGLSLSKRLMELMGGSIGVHSTYGSGSTFWIELPLASVPVAVAGGSASPDVGLAGTDGPSGSPAAGAADAAAAGQAAPGERLRILYVEDNPANLRLVEAMLHRIPGIRLQGAPDGATGLELARRELPDVIMLDIRLPDMSGFEVLGKLRADPATWSIPVIALSAEGMSTEVERSLSAGFDVYLVKPIERDELLRALHALVRTAARSVIGKHL